MKNKKTVLRLDDEGFANLLLEAQQRATKENTAKVVEDNGNNKPPLDVKKLMATIDDVKVDDKPALPVVDKGRIQEYKQENQEIRQLAISGGQKLFKLRKDIWDTKNTIERLRPFAEKEDVKGSATRDLMECETRLSQLQADEKRILDAGDDSYRSLLEFDYALEIIRHTEPDVQVLKEKIRILCAKGYCKLATQQEIDKYSKDRKWPEHTAFLTKDFVYFMGPLINTDGRKKALQTTLRKKFEEAQVMKAKDLRASINQDLSGFAKCVPGFYLFETKEHYDRGGKKHNPGFLVVELYDRNKEMKKTEEPFFVVKPVDGLWSLEWAAGEKWIPWFWLKEGEVIILEEKIKNYSAETLAYFARIVYKLCILYEIWDRGLGSESVKRNPKSAVSDNKQPVPEVQLAV